MYWALPVSSGSRCGNGERSLGIQNEHQETFNTTESTWQFCDSDFFWDTQNAGMSQEIRKWFVQGL